MSNPDLPEFTPITAPDEERASISGGIRRLFSSSKYLLVLVAIVGVVVMDLAGRISGEMALATIGGLISVAVGATAYEDAAEKVGGRPMSAKATAALVGGIQNMALTLLPALASAKAPGRPNVLVPGMRTDGMMPEDKYIIAAMGILENSGTELLGLSLCQVAKALDAQGADGSDLVRKKLGDELYLVHTEILDECKGNPSYPRKTDA